MPMMAIGAAFWRSSCSILAFARSSATMALLIGEGPEAGVELEIGLVLAMGLPGGIAAAGGVGALGASVEARCGAGGGVEARCGGGGRFVGEGKAEPRVESGPVDRAGGGAIEERLGGDARNELRSEGGA
jgi:hypothetical protein